RHGPGISRLLRNHVGTVQGSHETDTWKSRIQLGRRSGLLCLLGRAGGKAGEELLQFRPRELARDRAQHQLHSARRRRMWNWVAAREMVEEGPGGACELVHCGLWASRALQQRGFPEPRGASGVEGPVAGFVRGARGFDAGWT